MVLIPYQDGASVRGCQATTVGQDCCCANFPDFITGCASVCQDSRSPLYVAVTLLGSVSDRGNGVGAECTGCDELNGFIGQTFNIFRVGGQESTVCAWNSYYGCASGSSGFANNPLTDFYISIYQIAGKIRIHATVEIAGQDVVQLWSDVKNVTDGPLDCTSLNEVLDFKVETAGAADGNLRCDSSNLRLRVTTPAVTATNKPECSNCCANKSSEPDSVTVTLTAPADGIAIPFNCTPACSQMGGTFSLERGVLPPGFIEPVIDGSCSYYYLSPVAVCGDPCGLGGTGRTLTQFYVTASISLVCPDEWIVGISVDMWMWWCVSPPFTQTDIRTVPFTQQWGASGNLTVGGAVRPFPDCSLVDGTTISMPAGPNSVASTCELTTIQGILEL